MQPQAATLETEEYPSLVPLGKRERKLPVQTIYRGLVKISLGKCRNLVREKPGNPSRESWEIPRHNLRFAEGGCHSCGYIGEL